MKKEINFKAETPYEPAGDQPTAIKELTESILKGNRYQTLEGVTGSGKTYTMAKVIENVKMPTIILNKINNLHLLNLNYQIVVFVLYLLLFQL